MGTNQENHAITERAMALLGTDDGGCGSLDDPALDALADQLEDCLDDGELPEALHDLSSLAAHLRGLGLTIAADRLARLVAGFAGAVDELVQEEP